MSKKKRNRRPVAAAPRTQGAASSAPSLDAVVEAYGADIASQASADAASGAQPDARLEHVATGAGDPGSGPTMATDAASEPEHALLAELPGVEHEQAPGDEAAAEAQQVPLVDQSFPAKARKGKAPGPQPEPAPVASAIPSWTMHESGDIRGVLIQVAGGRLLLPNATIAEVLSYAEPERDEGSAEWMLGRLRWRGWHLPLVAFSQFAGIGEEKPGLGSKVIVLKALGGDRRLPFFAVITQGFPRLVTVSRSALSIDESTGELPPGVQALLRLNDEPALLPDLAQIESRLHEARDAA